MHICPSLIFPEGCTIIAASAAAASVILVKNHQFLSTWYLEAKVQLLLSPLLSVPLFVLKCRYFKKHGGGEWMLELRTGDVYAWPVAQRGGHVVPWERAEDTESNTGVLILAQLLAGCGTWGKTTLHFSYHICKMITIPTCEVDLIDIKHLLVLWTYQMCPHKALWSQVVA